MAVWETCGPFGFRLPLQRLGNNLLRRADGHNFAAAGAAFGAEIDNPIGRFDHVQIVLDHQHRVAGVDQVVQHFQQHLNVGKVQPGGRLVEQIERAAGAPFHQLAGQLDALRLAAGKRRRRLAELQVIQAHVVQRLQLAADVGNVLEMRRAPPAHPFPARRRCFCL